MRKYQVLLFLMLIQLKKTDSLRNSDEAAWNLAISEVNLCRGSKNSFCKTFLKILWNLQIKTCSRVCFLKHSATLKEDSGTSVFLWILKSFKKIFLFVLQNVFNSLLMLLERLLRKYTKPTTRMLVQ